MTKPASPIHAHYYKQLDALRFFSVAAVMIAHWHAWGTQIWLLKTMHWGNGVLFFFVLSGFLITEILLFQKEEIAAGERGLGASLKTFYIRRSLRIFPVYYLMIVFFFCMNFRNTRAIFAYLATYTVNIYESVTGLFVGDYNHFWSLAVEEQFYIFWPLLLFLLPKRHVLAGIIATVLLSIASRLINNFFFPQYWVAAMYLPNNVMFSLGLGALLAYLKRNRQEVFWKISNAAWLTPVLAALYLVSFFAIVHAGRLQPLQFLFDDLLFSLLAFVVIARCAGNGYRSFGKMLLENKVFMRLGKVSYGMYLFHQFVPVVYYGFALNWMMPDRTPVKFLLLLSLTWVAAELSYRVVETPMNRLKKHFKY